MFRKIRFRLADKRFLSELDQTFGPLYKAFLEKSSVMLTQYPRTVFAFMVLSIGLSVLVLAKDLLGSENKTALSGRANQVPVLTDPGGAGFYQGLEDISGAAAQMKRNVQLSKKVDSLLAKGPLTAQDSLWLMRALNALDR